MERRKFLFSLAALGSIGTLLSNDDLCDISVFQIEIPIAVPEPSPPVYRIQTKHSHRHEDGTLSSHWFTKLEKEEDLPNYLKSKNLQLSDIAILDKIN